MSETARERRELIALRAEVNRSDAKLREVVAAVAELANVTSERDMARINERSALSAYDGVCGLAEDLQSELAQCQRELANVTSERDYLRERLRELAEEMQTIADQAEPRSASVGGAARMAAWSAAAAMVRRIVNDSEGDDNETATPEVEDGT